MANSLFPNKLHSPFSHWMPLVSSHSNTLARLSLVIGIKPTEQHIMINLESSNQFLNEILINSLLFTIPAFHSSGTEFSKQSSYKTNMTDPIIWLSFNILMQAPQRHTLNTAVPADCWSRTSPPPPAAVCGWPVISITWPWSFRSKNMFGGTWRPAGNDIAFCDKHNIKY